MSLRPVPPPSRQRTESGAVLVLTSLFMVAALSLCAMAVDMGLARSKRAQYQAAADSAALLATYRVNNGIAVTQVSAEVKALVSSNLGIPASAWTSCRDPKRLADVATTDQAISNECISFNLAPPAGQQVGARVRLPMRDIDTVMGLGVGSIQVTAVAGADGNAGQCDIFDPASCATTTTAPPTTVTTTTRPSPTTTRPSPTTTRPSPTTTRPSPTTTRPSPTTTRPSPTTTRPAPTTTRPSPTTTRPSPTTTRPSPTTTRPAPTTTRPAPTTTIDISF